MNEQQDKYIDDIDFHYNLRPHGWSDCFIQKGNYLYEFALTHIFDDPIEVLLTHLTGFIRGENKVHFTWHSEPGKHECFFMRDKEQNHKLHIEITDGFMVNSGKNQITETVKITAKEFVFMTCVYHEMEKINQLSTEKTYRKTRDAFPQIAFKDFKQAYLNKYLR
jgi:hypothetical protein